MLARASHRRGFTLMEIMLVVTIIIVLVALLIPALSIAKKRSRFSDNQSLLTAIANAVESYESTFHAYPGPPISGMTTATTGDKMSGAQALLLALSYSWVDISPSSADVAPNDALSVFGTTAEPPNVHFTINNPVTLAQSTLQMNPTKPTGPRDHGNSGPTGAFRSLQPFYSPSSRDLSPQTPGSSPPVWPESGVEDTTSSPKNTFKFPVLMDHYSPPMPILYFRGTPGVVGKVVFGAGGDIDTSNTKNNTLVQDTTGATFLRRENIEYFDSPGFKSPWGISHDQNYYPPSAGSPPQPYSPLSSSVPGGADAANAAFAKLLVEPGKNVTRSPKGNSFILMCAGEDRVYGTADDIIVIR